MGEHGKHRSLVRAALFTLLCLWAAPAAACRLALVLAVDVSSSVDGTEDQLQRGGLATALISPEVQSAFFVSDDPVALMVFEWSGRDHQTVILPWTLVSSQADLLLAAETIRNSTRSVSNAPTAMGHALGFASQQLQVGPQCLFQTIDVSGDGVNNDGFGPALAYATFPFDGITVNGLVITGAPDSPVSYFEEQVKRGPLSFVEIADGFADFAAAMERKLIKELSARIIGLVPQPGQVPG
ncbi:MAG: DUF1194 domain-containing protein [Pseudomonadota bacterium]